MKYIFIDTCNYLPCALLTKKGHTPATIKKLIDLAEKKQITILLPEIVKIEFYRKVDEELKKIEKSVDKLIEEVNKYFPGYIEIGKKDLIDCVKKLLSDRKESSQVAIKEFNELFVNQNTHQIKLSTDIFLNAYKRTIGGEKPSKYDKWPGIRATIMIDNDCLIYESILDVLRNKPDLYLIFCSANDTDFAIKKDSSYVLHPDLQKSLPHGARVNYYTNLVDALNKEFKADIPATELRRFDIFAKYRESLGQTSSLLSESLANMLPKEAMAQMIKSLSETHVCKLREDLFAQMSKSFSERLTDMLPREAMAQMIKSMQNDKDNKK